MTNPNLAEIRARAEAATPEPWEIIGGGEYVTGVGLIIGRECDGGVTSEDAAHIAGMDPTTVLALLDRLEAAEAAVERVRGDLE